jgi:hypothetical protein
MSAIHVLLEGLIDYAGLYPPASLDMVSAVENYISYSHSSRAFVLGRFVVGSNRLEEVREVAGENLRDMRLTVVTAASAGWNDLTEFLERSFRIESIETQPTEIWEIPKIQKSLPVGIEDYYEIPLGTCSSGMINAISDAGGRAKLRMGGVVPEAIPPANSVALILMELAARHIPFKATAGLHHPIRSPHSLTGKTDGPTAMMHGFLNLAFAAVLLRGGGAAGEALHVLEEEDPAAWSVEPDAVVCRGLRWTADQLAEMRKKFFLSLGSCSFEEPIQDLEALGWL